MTFFSCEDLISLKIYPNLLATYLVRFHSHFPHIRIKTPFHLVSFQQNRITDVVYLCIFLSVSQFYGRCPSHVHVHKIQIYLFQIT